MIGEGARAEAASAAAELRNALGAAGIRLPSMDVDPCVWDSGKNGIVRAVNLGAVPPAAAHRIARLIRLGAGRAMGPAVELSGAVPEPNPMAYPPCRCIPDCLSQSHAVLRAGVRNNINERSGDSCA